jgi:hypothetical protein
LSYPTASQVTLTANDSAGTVTVTVGGRGRSCSQNSIQFTVITPTATLYVNHAGTVRHDYSFADIGVQSDMYLEPDSVSFLGLSRREEEANFSASGVWACFDTHPHEKNPPPINAVGADVPGYGSLVSGTDDAFTATCTVNQFQGGLETVNIQTSYAADGVNFLPLNAVTQAAYESSDGTGTLTMSKDHAQGTTTVNHANQYY